MSFQMCRRNWLGMAAGSVAAGTGLLGPLNPPLRAANYEPAWDKSIDQGLQWIANTQSRLGHWTAGNYPAAMTALAGTALLCSGSTTTQGPYAKYIRRAVDYLSSKARKNGLIGNPLRDNRYTYGHGFSMLFLSQVLGEEEDLERRHELIDLLTQAVQFSGQAQTSSGGWGYVSAKDGSNFDEGSTTITQVQGLRGCRNAGILFRRRLSRKLGNISIAVRTRMEAFLTVLEIVGRRDQPSRQLRWRHFTMQVTTTASTCPTCSPIARKTFIPSRIKIGPSDTGIILTCTTPKSFIVKEPVSGRFFGINCITGLLVNNKTMDPGWVTSAPSM